jgi:hypothetical protein
MYGKHNSITNQDDILDRITCLLEITAEKGLNSISKPIHPVDFEKRPKIYSFRPLLPSTVC